MHTTLNFVALSLILFFASRGQSQSSDGVFDVTKYGAVPDADISQVNKSFVFNYHRLKEKHLVASIKIFFFFNYILKIKQALKDAWKEACASTSQSTIIIPNATYKLSAIELVGHCKSPIKIQLQGTLQAPADLTGEDWVHFKYIDHFSLTSGGVFDGQGKQAWENNDCDKNPNCARIPMVSTLKLSN